MQGLKCPIGTLLFALKDLLHSLLNEIKSLKNMTLRMFYNMLPTHHEWTLLFNICTARSHLLMYHLTIV